MSEENVEIVRRVVEAWNRGDVDAFLSLYEPDCEVVFRPEVPEPGPFHGHAELKQWVEGFLDAWESHRVEVVEVMEAGDSIVAVVHMVGRGSGSGVDLDETDAHFFTIREGRIARWQNFNARAEALEAAGMSDQS
jgi:ketosteroid isomerase-like protein